MKKSIFITISVFVFISSCGQSKNQVSEIEAKNMLKKFYTTYNKVWSNTSNPDILVKKIDSLKAIYCTLNLTNKIKKQFKLEGLDHDLLTIDQVADLNQIEKLLVTKDSVKPNVYIVSYIEDYTNPSNKKEFKMAIIHVAVVKDKSGYKIDSVW
ncbi:hypothetical protein [Flavobacterium psychrotolerans]|uniref:DUF3828 domain-containing protein n=1 Tax=Flavobacterium psychrotolerans TaxID=2169410 RepID=A0A2U1JKP6_9FLAO|nr:hypothetical protein [Flavobacterium psychrotolerans]PWA05575.1 hypothetical protein DB895_06205 [Flavobacterium psychrotolerans]